MKRFLLILIIGLGCVFPTLLAASPNANDLKIETSIIDGEVEVGGESARVAGVASGEIRAVELAIRREDGLFWRVREATWTPEPNWQKGTVTPIAAGRFSWDETLVLPPIDGGRISLLARAMGKDTVDPTPAGKYVSIDNVAPEIAEFKTESSGWVKDRDVDLTIDARGAKFMRFAESRKALKSARKIKYRQSAKVRLSAGDGQKQIFGEFFDKKGNSAVSHLPPKIGLDTAAPVVKDMKPAPEANSVSVDAKISVKFIEESGLDTATIDSDVTTMPTFYLETGGMRTTATVTYDSRTKTAVLTPELLLVEGEMYTAYIESGIKDIVGNELKKKTQWSFSAVTPSPPETKIKTFIENVNSKGVFKVTGTASDPDGISSVGVSLRDANGRYWDSASASWTVEYFANEAKLNKADAKQAFWEWSWPLPTGNGDRYLVTAAARDSFLAIDSRPAGAYLTLDNEAPRIEQFVLQNNVQVTASDTVGIENIIADAREMRFGESLEELKNAKYQPFADQHEITLSKKPGRKRIYGQWRDSYMNATRPGEKGSIAKVVHDKDGPKVSSTFPHNRADDVNISVMITANFDEISIDELSINTETVSLKGSDGTIIPTKVVFDALSKTVSLTPFELLTYDALYKVVIDDAVQDRLGNNLDKDFKWTFRTIDVSDHPPDKPVHVEVVSTRYGDSITWSPPRGFDKGRDFNPPVQGGYNVYRSERRKGPFELVNKVPLTETRYIDSDYGEPGKRFYFVRAVDAGGSESEASTTKVNDKISAVFNLRSGKATTVTSANDMIRLSVPRLKKSTKISIKNSRPSEAPITPLPVFELDSSPTVTLRRLVVRVPGNPDGAVLAKKVGRAWQPMGSNLYSYDTSGQSATFDSVRADGSFAIINQFDATPPRAPGKTELQLIEGEPQISWSKGVDRDSGISAYRLFRSESPLAETTAAITTVDLSDQIGSFDDRTVLSDHQYFYGVAAVNGSGQVSEIVELDSTHTPFAKIGHKPRVAGVTNCRLCHLEKRLGAAATIFNCRLCHDGTGSTVVIKDFKDSARSSLCRRCHKLSKRELDQAQKVESGECGGCHKDNRFQDALAGSSHNQESRMNSLQCGNCHSLHRPGDTKNKYLVDPANAKVSWSGSKNDFCLGCHKSGSSPTAIETSSKFLPKSVVFREMISEPFFPGWDKSGWAKAGHSRVTQCLTCHDPHESPNGRLVGYRSRAGKYVYFSDLTATEELCFECHRPGGPSGASDIMTLSRLSSNHKIGEAGLASQTDTASNSPSVRHIDCGDCHNVHEANSTPRQEFSNLVSGSIMGVGGIEPRNAGPGTIPDYLEVNPVTREYQICLKCHSSYLPLTGLTDLAVQFNPANLSFHPVMARGRNRGLKSSSFANGWSQKATMYCSDCHKSSSDSSDVRGPHGSKNESLVSASGNDLCYQCHSRKVYESGKSGSRFDSRGGHRLHVRGNSLDCADCHITHGSSFTDHLVKIVNSYDESGTVVYSHDTTGGSCISSCHKRPNENYQYRHEY